MKPVIIICGSTATGKSALAVEIAKLIDGEVISADSRQVYTGLDIGSAKITVPEMEGIPHHLINVAEPNTIFTVADFQKLAQEKIADIHARGKMPIICGGTGMYIDAVIYNTTFPEVIANPGLRKELEKYSAEELFEQLQTLDPDRATEIDSQNPVRLIRAIEIATELGSVPKMKQMDSIYETLFIGLELSKELLQERIITRIQNRIPALFDEIKKLHNSGVSYERLHSFGLEYRYGSEHVQGNITLDEFNELLSTKTWQFAKRQMTWFKRNSEINWFNPINDQQKILKQVQDFLRLNNN
jgi:tRNA dimethylallyltransferase